jgi:hypothetical protein
MINLRGGKVYLGSQFQMFHSMVAWPCNLWTCGEAENASGECVAEEDANFMAPGNQRGQEGAGHPTSP